MAGHLFIARSDLTQISYDAWLVPSDFLLTIEDAWLGALPSEIRSRETLRSAAPAGFGRDRHAFAFRGSAGGPLPVITDIGGGELE